MNKPFYEAVTAPPGRRVSDPARGGAVFRVAIISYSLPREGKKRGGIERVAHDLADALALRGHEVTVWSYDPSPPGASYHVRELPCRRFATSWLGLRLSMGYLGNVISALPDYSREDVIVAMGDSLLLPLKRKPVLRVMHGSGLGEALSSTSILRFVMQLGVYAQELLSALTQRGVVAVSENTRRHNPFIGRVIPNGVDLTAFHPVSAKSSEPTILFVGTLDGRKRGKLLLEWFEEKIRPVHPTAKLLFVGPSGPAQAGVEYLTGISTQELARAYREAWVYASPSSYEGFGLPYVEAMASGTAVVATPNPGSREVVQEGEFGVLASDEEFPAEVCRLLGDREAREEYERKGVRRAADFGLDAMIDAYEATLWDLIGARTGRDG